MLNAEQRLRELDKELEEVQNELALMREIRDLPLKYYFRRLIAARAGISPEEVTPEYILKQRELTVYPNTRFDIHSAYGGYQGQHLMVLTRNEIEELAQKTEKALEHFVV